MAKKSIQILPVASLNISELNLLKFEFEDDKPVWIVAGLTAKLQPLMIWVKSRAI